MKKFDLGIYQFHRTVNGPLCPSEDLELKNGQIVGVLHPISKADPDSMYCFAVKGNDKRVLTLVRKNLRFKKVVTMDWDGDNSLSYAEEIHGKIAIAQKYLQTNQQLTL